MNVFFIETPLQLLNAIEAKNYFEFENNTLIILLSNAFNVNSFSNIVVAKEWDRIIYLPLRSHFVNYDFGIRRPRNLYEKFVEYYLVIHQLIKRQRLDRIINNIGNADNIIIGNYLQGHKDYMRHFANTLEHKKMYLVDDGTDTILVTKERASEITFAACNNNNSGSIFRKIKKELRASYIDWNGKPAQSITFFTSYDLSVSAGDHIVRNEYRHLRGKAQGSEVTDEILFLGQCLVDDGYISKEDYIFYLSKAKEYFVDEKFIYVPHPRESLQIVEYIKKTVELEIRKLSVPIEYELAFSGKIPKYLSSFFCSALENCLIILDKAIPIKSFYLYPQHLIRHKTAVEEIYTYFESKGNPAFEVVKVVF